MFEGILQPTHLILILLIAVVVFGPSKLGDLGGSLGKAIREFRDSVKEPAPETPAAQGDDDTPKVA